MSVLALSLLSQMALAPVDFQRNVQGLLAGRCLPCHGRDAAARQADLRLDLRDQAIAERRGGAAIVPGDPAASRLMQRIGASDPDDRMPPGDHAPLTAQEIDLLHRWIEEGAVYEDHWAWQPLDRAVVPDAGAGWAKGAIDAYIAQDLAEAGLAPSPPADSGTWLRRLSFDLTGLPPDPDLLERFTAADTPAHREEIIESLLNSPAFGEHWSRHWLDAFSYAETCGHEFDYPLRGAWRFRDWLVRALNQDVPWGRIAGELIAGDLMEPRLEIDTGLNDAPLGTGFWTMHQAVHAPVEVLRDEDDHRSDQLDLLGRGLLAVTISCARCHDHKFDPISARDYQALANMLRSSRRVIAGRDQNAAVAESVESLRDARTRLDEDVRRLRAWIAAAGAMGAGRPRPGNAPTPLAPPTEQVHADFEAGTDWTFSGHAFELAPAGTWFPTAEGPRIAQRGMLHSGLLGTALAGTASSGEFKIEADRIHWRVKGRGTLRVIVDDYIMDEFNPLLFEGHRQEINSESWTTISHDVAKYVGHRAYLLAEDGGEGALQIDAVSFDDEPPWSPPVEDIRARGLARLDWHLAQARDETLRSGCGELLDQASRVSPPVPALRMTDATVVEQPVYVRGEPDVHGEPAPRSPGPLLGDGRSVDHGSGRLQLARAVTSPDTPMLWRTAANRIWHHLTGRGLVVSLDDMGAMGRPPSHPELLDHLALVLAEGGSVKDLVRRIVSSATWAQASSRRAEAEATDPDNVLLHRMRLRRLTGEQIRDAMLQASGGLDRSVGGPAVPIHITEEMTGRGRPAKSGPLDGDGRRSLYLSVRRNFAVPMMEAFDRPTPNRSCGRRTVSNVPAQSLALMNDPFVRSQAALLAERVRDAAGEGDDALRLLARLTWSRSLEPVELESLRPDTPDDWTDLAHAMLCAKEFMFLP